MTQNKMAEPGTARHQWGGRAVNKPKKEGFWEETQYWTLFIHQHV
jgi:hypothetical protein